MKKVRTFINVALGSIIAALSMTSCDKKDKEIYYVAKYGIPLEIDTTIHCMYGVDPDPIIHWNDNNNE